MSLTEIDTLRRLRRHRADRAERALSEAKRHQQALLGQIQQAQQALEQARLQEIQKTAELLEKHQGQVLSLSQLKAWGTQERTLSAGTRREEGQLHELHGRREQQVVQIASAQKRVSQCLKEVEKLQDLSVLLAQEGTQEEI
ncbi:type III secretion protein RspO [Pseudomonas fluorescens]|uniref:Type III secretion protein RspO n=1 Tax=Pseudomonas fluorescens TaxID=294 RepID=A0A379I8I0_PSEFL|nr:YscO family type III secretion system apparatus protein [Pseudomonas fluorescens]AIG04842.1 type III secretion protein [Pseudomonas fluorescens]SUD29166.1 type III secretion protein RspO [Pseudomonas fluorescens]